MSKLSALIIGSLNTDIIALGIGEFPQPGHHTYGEVLKIAPGGKSRNVAHMMGELLEPGEVAMVGLTVEDKYGLWKVPVNALDQVGVNINHVIKLQSDDPEKLPGIAIIAVNKEGQNEIIVLPGVSHDLTPSHIDDAQPVFDEVAKNKGYLCLGLEAPLVSVIHAAKKAAKLGIKTILDPGGVKTNVDYSDLINENIFLVKPNEHEAKILTGIEVKNLESAKKAAKFFQERGIKHVLITAGEKGAYLISESQVVHISIPKIKISLTKDETGCGDQTLAALVTALIKKKSIQEAAEFGVKAGTLQFYKSGVVPLKRSELQ